MEISQANLENARRHGVIDQIHADDFVFDFVRTKLWNGDHDRAVANYYELGNYSATLAREYFEEVQRVSRETKSEWAPKKVLDFASGYGCVARHLPKRFPDLEISTCDIHAGAVQFNEEVLKLRSHLSSSIPEEFSIPKQDAIIALSFFSHIPERSYARWLGALATHLAPGGALIFTSNGYVTQKKLFPAWIADDRGYAFRPDSEQHDLNKEDYGLTLAAFPFVWNILKSRGDLKLSRFQEGVWWAVQDVYVCVKYM